MRVAGTRVLRGRPVKSHSNCSILPAAIRINYRVEKKSYRFPIPGRRQQLCADSHGSFGIRVNVNCGKMETTKCTFFSIFPEGKFLFQQILREISTFLQYNYFRMVLETSYKKSTRGFVFNSDPGHWIRYSESEFRSRKQNGPQKEVGVFFLKIFGHQKPGSRSWSDKYGSTNTSEKFLFYPNKRLRPICKEKEGSVLLFDV